jgi:hypothetical protein
MVTVTSGANVQATISGSVSSAFPTPATGQVIVSKSSGKSGQAITAGTGILIYTVTGGKTLYVTSMSWGQANDANARRVEYRDGTTIAGTIRGSAVQGANASCVQTFPTPVPFTSGIFLDIDATCNSLNWSFNGWEQ